jgi:hypothetical protein
MAFEHSLEIAGEPAALFALTQDYARRLEWDPFLRSAELVGAARQAGMGVRAYCVARSGLAMESEYIAYSPPHVAAVKMTRGPWFLSSFAGTWRFEEVVPGRTRVLFRYHFRAKPVFLSWLLMPIMLWVFSRDTRKRLKALKTAVEQRGFLQGGVAPT